MIKRVFLISSMAVAVMLSGCTAREMPQSPNITVSPQAGNFEISKNIKTTIQNMARSGWIIEKAETNQVVAGLHIHGHYLQITYFIQQHQVSSQITASQNLDQKNNKIHRNALRWKARLDQRVFQKLAVL